jgi:uncharacterized protein
MRAMSTQARTDAVFPHELARKHGRFTGEISIAAFPRLGELAPSNGCASVDLYFSRDDQSRSRIRGSVRVLLDLQCQRCLGPVERMLDVPIDVCVVASDAQAYELANEIEPFVLDEESISIVELIEDDLLLALPSQVCVAYEDCPNRPQLSFPRAAAPDNEVTKQARPNPFDVLAELKNRDN